MLIYKPICERWAEEADERKVREMAALVDGDPEPRMAPVAQRGGVLGALATTLRSILPIRR